MWCRGKESVGEPSDVHAACESEECPVHDNFRDNSIAAQVKQEIEDEQQHVDIKYEDILITNGIINITPNTSFCATDGSYSSDADDDEEFKDSRLSNGQVMVTTVASRENYYGDEEFLITSKVRIIYIIHLVHHQSTIICNLNRNNYLIQNSSMETSNHLAFNRHMNLTDHID